MEQSTPLLSPDDLMLFAHVAELGSFTAAAERLGLPKSTVSRRLSALEQQVGERLLLRTTRRQALTEFGSQLLEHARQLAAEVEAASALSAHRQAQPSGRLRVSMPMEVATLLSDMLAAFGALHPAISLELDLSPRRVDLLGEGFDLALRMGALPDDALLAARRLGVFSQGLSASPDYLAEHGEPHTPDDLQQHHALRGLESGGEAARWLLRRNEDTWQGVPPGRLTANSPILLLGMARAGAGITAAPDYFALPDVRRGTLRRVLPEWCLPSHTAWAVFPGRKLMPAKTRVFIDMLQAALGDLPGSPAPEPAASP